MLPDSATNADIFATDFEKLQWAPALGEQSDRSLHDSVVHQPPQVEEGPLTVDELVEAINI